MKRFVPSFVISTFALASLVAFAPAARSAAPASTPVIVVFRDGASFENDRGAAQRDERAQAAPEAWDYLDRGVVGAVQAREHALGFRATHVYSHTVRGFAAHLSAKQIEKLAQDPDVEYIEEDREVHANAQSLPWGIDRIDADASSALAGNGSGAVTNVRAYVIDTGIDTTHPDLTIGGHVNFAGGQNRDCNGHGTHVAGTVGAKDDTTYVVGAAPGIRLYGVKVLGCSGSGYMSWVTKGVDWVTANAVKPAVANMSLGGGATTTLDTAVQRSAASGVFYAVAAGNDGADACNSSPARAAASAAGVLAVGATSSSNQSASWSNWGDCVGIWAPGVSILSTRKGGGTTTMSGTSMASPHVAGAAALFLSRYPGASMSEVKSALRSDATSFSTVAKDGAAITIVNAGGY